MQFTKSLLLLAALTTSAFAQPVEPIERRQAATSTGTTSASSPSSAGGWDSVPANGVFSTAGFGGVTTASGSGDTYVGNVGDPYGSNIIEVSASEASKYKYVIQFSGANTSPWTVAIWNKFGPDGKMTGHYGNACKTFSLSPGSKKYFAFAEDTNGGFAAAEGSTIPTSPMGAYASTWGEFDFGSTTNNAWSGFDVSAIQAQNNGMPVQGMKICSVYNDSTCSSISPNAAVVNNAYTSAETDIGGIGGNLGSGPVRLAVTIGYKG